MAKSTNEVTYEITYKGDLTGNGEVYLHYGYENWTDVSEKKMRNLKSSCKTEVTLPKDQELNFCFRDGANNWDNNYGNNYYFGPASSLDYGYVDVTAKVQKKVTTSKTTTKTTSTKTVKGATKSKTASKKQ